MSDLYLAVLFGILISVIIGLTIAGLLSVIAKIWENEKKLTLQHGLVNWQKAILIFSIPTISFIWASFLFFIAYLFLSEIIIPLIPFFMYIRRASSKIIKLHHVLLFFKIFGS